MPRRALEPVTRRSVRAQIVDQLRAAIRDGDYAPGAALPSERELSRTFGVTRPMLREALAALETLGLLERVHGRGTKVAGAGAARASEIFPRLSAHGQPPGLREVRELRLLFEVQMARLAAERATRDDQRRLASALERNRAAISGRQAYVGSDLAFHRALAAMSGNRLFAELSEALFAWLARRRPEVVHVDGANLLSHREHARIAACVAARDPEGAARAMLDHLTRSHAGYRQIPARRARTGRADARRARRPTTA
jgi:DNA-binding FadR family transcriptional regulator